MTPAEHLAVSWLRSRYAAGVREPSFLSSAQILLDGIKERMDGHPYRYCDVLAALMLVQQITLTDHNAPDCMPIPLAPD